jgi:proteic killer suppression protein
MIRSFRDKRTEAVFNGQQPKGFPSQIFATAQRKLTMLNAATILDDLKIPPANRLEALKGDRKGQHSIRVNDQFRVCFIWRDGGAEQVEITDYH